MRAGSPMLSSDHNPAGCVDADPGRPAALPLCVDLDGTLIHGDLLWECIVLLLKKNPFCLLLVPFWLVSGGRAKVKRQLAQRADLEPGNMAYNRELLEFLQAEHRRGRTLVLATAADQQLAETIAAHTGLFHRVHGSREGQNLKGRAKAGFLGETFGIHGFEYAGNSLSDMHVWRISGGAYVVGSEATAERAASVTQVRRWFPSRKRDLNCWSRAIRIHHWSKNLLMLIPILLAHRLTWHALLLTLLGVVLFGLCSSGVYILNDLLDLHSDRAHPWKSKRPFATGELSIASGLRDVPGAAGRLTRAGSHGAERSVRRSACILCGDCDLVFAVAEEGCHRRCVRPVQLLQHSHLGRRADNRDAAFAVVPWFFAVFLSEPGDGQEVFGAGACGGSWPTAATPAAATGPATANC